MDTPQRPLLSVPQYFREQQKHDGRLPLLTYKLQIQFHNSGTPYEKWLRVS